MPRRHSSASPTTCSAPATNGTSSATRASATAADRSPSSTSGAGTSSDSSAGARVVDAPESSASTRMCPSTRTGWQKEWERRDESFLGDVYILIE